MNFEGRRRSALEAPRRKHRRPKERKVKGSVLDNGHSFYFSVSKTGTRKFSSISRCALPWGGPKSGHFLASWRFFVGPLQLTTPTSWSLLADVSRFSLPTDRSGSFAEAFLLVTLSALHARLRFRLPRRRFSHPQADGRIERACGARRGGVRGWRSPSSASVQLPEVWDRIGGICRICVSQVTDLKRFSNS